MSLFGLTQFPSHQIHKRIVQRHHPTLAAELDDGRQLEGLAFANQVADGCRPEKNLTRRYPATTTNSMGSSIVRMCWFLFRFTRSTNAARVIDFPEPVGPVTTTRPLEQKRECAQAMHQGHRVPADERS